MATTTANDILSASENYGKAQTAFSLALGQAASQRQQAMIGLGADFTTQTGKVINPIQAGKALGGGGALKEGTTMITGYGEGALPTITKTQASAVNEVQQALLEKGVGGTSGLAGQAKLVTQDQGALETQAAVLDVEGKIAQADLAQVAAKGDLRSAKGSLDTAMGVKTKLAGKRKKGGKK